MEDHSLAEHGGAVRPKEVTGPTCQCANVVMIRKSADAFVCPTVYGGCGKLLKLYGGNDGGITGSVRPANPA